MPLTTHTVSSVFGPDSRVGMELRGSPQLCLPTEYIGVEIELEQADLNINPTRRFIWPENESLARALVNTHADGSLRNGVELVFRQPLFGEQAIAAIDAMFAIKEINRLSDSVRTSTHVHVNYSDVTIDVPIRAAALCSVIEPYIVSTAGTHREANCYAVSIRGSDFLTNRRVNHSMYDFIIGQANSHRYLGFNMAALAKYGTIEYRYFGGLERDSVIALVNMLLEQKKVAMMATPIVQLVQQYETIRDFIVAQLPYAAAFLKLDSVSREEDLAWRDEVLMRLVSSVAFSEAMGNLPDAEEYDGNEYDNGDAEDTSPAIPLTAVDPAITEIPMPDDAVFVSRQVESIDRYVDLMNRVNSATAHAVRVR